MEKVLQKYLKKNAPELKSGDTVKVHLKVKEGTKERVQIFEGLVIAVKHGAGLDGTFTVRKESFGVGVERVFPTHSPRVVKVERVKQSKVRRSKLYYMRELSGKNARLKDLNRDHKVWEEKGAEEELEKIAAETAALAEAEAAKKAAEDAELAAKAEALAGDRIVEDKKDEKAE
jgi:large subunit ribosomal protein L19